MYAILLINIMYACSLLYYEINNNLDTKSTHTPREKGRNEGETRDMISDVIVKEERYMKRN